MHIEYTDTHFIIYCGDQPPSPHQINKTNDNYSGGAIKYDIKSIILKSIVRGRFAFQNQLIRLGRSIDRSTWSLSPLMQSRSSRKLNVCMIALNFAVHTQYFIINIHPKTDRSIDCTSSPSIANDPRDTTVSIIKYSADHVARSIVKHIWIV